MRDARNNVIAPAYTNRVHDLVHLSPQCNQTLRHKGIKEMGGMSLHVQYAVVATARCHQADSLSRRVDLGFHP